MVLSSNERKLVADVRAGGHEAFERLLDIYENKVFNLARRMVGAQDAEDVAQEALIEICGSIRSFRGNSSLSTWIYRVAMNTCLQHLRKRHPQTVSLEEDLCEQKADPNDDPADVALRNDVRSEVESAIESLPEIYRKTVILHEMHGLTYRECAEVLHCPVGTVKSRLSSAFAKLREVLRDYAPEGGPAK